MTRSLEEIIGYSFKNKQLLRQAMLHSSYVNEHRLHRKDCNERLEFLGDAVLELSASEILYRMYPDYTEGELTKLRAAIVCEPTLALCAEELSLGDRLLLGKGEEATGGRYRASIVSDAMEALIGAIYLDGGFTNAKEFIQRFIMNDIEKKQLFYDSKTILQEWVQGQGLGTLSYTLTAESGPEHDKLFTVVAMIGGAKYEEGSGRTKKAAEQQAAYRTLLRVKK